MDKPELSEKELELRQNYGWKVLCKDPTMECPPERYVLAENMSYLREALVSFSKYRLQAVVVFQFNTFYPSFTFGGGRKVVTFDDLKEAFVNAPYTKGFAESGIKKTQCKSFE